MMVVDRHGAQVIAGIVQAHSGIGPLVRPRSGRLPIAGCLACNEHGRAALETVDAEPVMTVFPRRALVIVMCAGIVACDDSTGGTDGTCNIPEHIDARRADFALLTRGTVYFGPATVVDVCSPTLSAQEAYPGIDERARMARVVLFDVEPAWSSAPMTSTTIAFSIPLSDEPLPEHLSPGARHNEHFVSVAEYQGPSEPALDADYECENGSSISPGAFLRSLYFSPAGPQTAALTECHYGMTVEEFEAALDEAAAGDPQAGTARTTQESFVGPAGLADAVVGPTGWPPPPLFEADP